MKNQQRIFNKVAKHLLTQNKKALKGNICVYKTENNLKCAIGCLIPSKMYRKSMEYQTIIGLFINFPNLKKFLKIKNESFLRELQMIHDTYIPSVWRQALINFAKQYHLNSSIINKFKTQ